MRSRFQQKRSRQSRRRQTIRRGGRPGIDNKHWKVRYDVHCQDISALNLFNMANTGLFEMATGWGNVAILGVENVVVSHQKDLGEEVFCVQLNVKFEEEMGPSDLNEWKEAYLAAIREQELFADGTFVPNEDSFTYEPIAEEEYAK
jgi:hypothetical protein